MLPLPETYLEHLRALPFVKSLREVRPGKSGSRPLPVLAIRTPHGEERVPIALKRGAVSRELAERWASEAMSAPAPCILFVPPVGRELGDRLEELGICFVDEAGNSFVNLSDRYISRIQARRAEPKAAADKGMRAPAFRALFALLADASLARASVRTLATAAGVSRQAALDIRPRLESLGIMYEAPKRGFGWRDGRVEQAIDLFITGYSTTLRSQLQLGAFRTPAKDPGDLERELEAAARALQPGSLFRWGGGSAAMRMAGYYHGPRTVIHTDSAPRLDFRKLKAIPDRNGPFEVLGLPGPLALRGTREDTVHPLLVYAELMREQTDRAREAGRQILDAWRATQGFP